MSNTDKLHTLLATPADDRSQAQTAELRTGLQSIAKSLSKDSRALLSVLRGATKGLVRVEGTNRFEITDKDAFGKQTQWTFDNAALRPLIRAGLVTCQGVGTVGITSVTPLGNATWIHF